MDQDLTFRPVLVAGVLAVVLVIGYHRVKAGTREPLDRRQEGPFILWTLRPAGLMLWLATIAYMINPAWMAWSSIAILPWLRWTGAGVCAVAVVLLFWTLRSLGKNLTDTVVTRREHTLVTRGPYRWVRHPFYGCFALLIAGNALVAANWFVLVTGTVVLLLLVVRTRKEEENLLVRFGEPYRAYRMRTGRFVPSLRGMSGRHPS